jgi:sigma-B regulation protein RsbU (phosphoserine phosphatase)
LLALLNNALFQLLPDSDFLTVFYGIIDTNSLELIFTNAGHPRPFLYRNLECCVEELAVGGPLIGAFPNMAYDEENIQLAPGDGILVFTDGVTEAEKISSSDIFYGENRLSRVFLESCCLESSEILRVIMNDLEEFRGDTMFDDDVSMMLASVK